MGYEMNYPAVAKELLTLLGGKSNITALAHCATRLRLAVADEQKIERLSDANEIIQEGQVSIDIKKDAKDFIESGVTTLIDINGSKFVLWSSARKKNFLDLEMYSYKLKVTN